MQRPLSVLSNFVVQDMPECLANDPKDLWQRIHSIVEVLTEEDINNVLNSNQRELATLDLKMLEAALVHSGMEVPARLTELVELFSADEIKGLTYEDIVLINPIEDLRTFSCGEVYQTESLFYNEHRVIEDRLGRIITDIQSVIEHAVPVLSPEQIESELNYVVSSTARLARMTNGHFDRFRNYLNPLPKRGLKGPSGAFSARIPTLELYFRGESLPNKYFDYLRHNWGYFPRRDRSLLEEAEKAVRAGRTLTALAGDKLQDERNKRISILEMFFERFRKAHFAAVSRQTPKALSGEVAGTGGEANVKEFLEGRMNRE